MYSLLTQTMMPLHRLSGAALSCGYVGKVGNRLLLQHHLKARVFKAERHVDEIEIRYETFR